MRKDQTQEQETAISAFWRRYAPYWHICMFILGAIAFAVMWYSTVNNAIADVDQSKKDIQVLQITIAGMVQEIHDMHEWLKNMRHRHDTSD